MKNKSLILLLLTALSFALFGCGAKTEPIEAEKPVEIVEEQTDDTTVDEATTEAAAAKKFEAIWNLFEEDEKFPAIGGDIDNTVDGAPGSYALDDQDGLIASYYVPEEQIGNVDDAATMMHMMNANTFTGVVVHVADTASFAADLKTNIDGTQWICGFPDKLYVADLGDGYIAYAFGEKTIMQTYIEKVSQAYPEATSLYDENLAAEF